MRRVVSILVQINNPILRHFDTFFLKGMKLGKTGFFILYNYFPLGINNTMPRQSVFSAHAVEQSGNLAGASWTPSMSCNSSIGHYFAFWDTCNNFDRFYSKRLLFVQSYLVNLLFCYCLFFYFFFGHYMFMVLIF